MDYASSAFDHRTTTDYEATDAPVVAQKPHALLSVTERSVISLSFQDTLESISEMPKWRKRIARLFGHEQPNRLANKPLEELRRFAILARVRGEVDDDMLRRFLNAGYRSEQADLVVRLLALHIPKRSPIGSGAVAWLLVAIAATGTYLFIEKTVDEPAISMILTSITFVTLASITIPRDGRHR